jgi:hypothetical protein
MTAAACLWMLAIHLFMAGIGRMNYFNETRYFATILRSENRRPGEPVYLYDTYLRGLPFYLRGPVRLIDYASPEYGFEQQRGEVARCLSSESRFLESFRGEGRLFAVLRRTDLARLLADVGRPIHLLALTRRHALVTNRPAPEKEARAAAVVAAAGADLSDRLGRAARLLPGVSLAVVELETENGVLQASLFAPERPGSPEVIVPVAPPGQPRVEAVTPVEAESNREDHLIRIVLPDLQKADPGGILDSSDRWH